MYQRAIEIEEFELVGVTSFFSKIHLASLSNVVPVSIPLFLSFSTRGDPHLSRHICLWSEWSLQPTDVTLCRLKSDKKGGKREREGDRERRARGTLTNRRKMRTRELGVPFFFFFFLSCTRCSNEKGLEYLKARILSTFCSRRSETISSGDRDGTIK